MILNYMWNLKNQDKMKVDKDTENKQVMGVGIKYGEQALGGISHEAVIYIYKKYGQYYCNNFIWEQMVTRLAVIIFQSKMHTKSVCSTPETNIMFMSTIFQFLKRK